MIYISQQPGLFNSELYHHGTKGMHWGERRYQNSNGTWTEEGKERRRIERRIRDNSQHTDDVNDIVRTLSKKEREFLGAEKGKDWIDKQHERETMMNKAKTFVAKQGNVPVSFVEIWTNGGTTGQIALATRNDPKYRGKGHASSLVEQALTWAERYGNTSIKELEWIADKRNTASVALAKKYGFIEDAPDTHDWSKEYAYMRKQIGKK